MSQYFEWQSHRVMIALASAGYAIEDVTKLSEYRGLGNFRFVLNGKAGIVPAGGQGIAEVLSTSYSEQLAHELMIALEAAKFSRTDVTKLGQYPALGDFRHVIEGRAQIVSMGRDSMADILLPDPGIPPDFIVRINREQYPAYSIRVKRLMHPEFECSGPPEYDLSDVELWLHSLQSGLVKGQVIYEYFISTNTLGTCLNLQDGLAIQKLGIAVFRRFFRGKSVFLWKSVVQRADESLAVPYLSEKAGKVVLRWYWLDYDWHARRPALRFAKEKVIE